MNAVATKFKCRALGLRSGGVEGRRRSFNSVSEEKVHQMMKVTYQQRTEAKIKWAVKCYNDWRQMRLEKVDYDDAIFAADFK